MTELVHINIKETYENLIVLLAFRQVLKTHDLISDYSQAPNTAHKAANYIHGVNI
jgi:hypothetical protein